MNKSQPRSREEEALLRGDRVDRWCDEFERQWKAGKPPRIEAFLAQADQGDREHLLRELIALEMSLRLEAGHPVDSQQYDGRFAGSGHVVDSAVASFQERQAGKRALCSTTDARRHDDSNLAPAQPGREVKIPRTIGRYDIVRLLGEGGFGVVYLARDAELDRDVALKIPRLDRFTSQAALELFVEEARKAAQLEHPGIVRIHDVQREPRRVYIVQQYLAGGDLARRFRSDPPSPRHSAELLVGIAEAVGFAHQHGYTHLDLKPANVLLDPEGKPYVADFGLAVHESVQRDLQGQVVGTYAYMSPEQSRGETHRLDGRSDIWSLGVIFYESLTGRRPFDGETLAELLDEIQFRDPRPPRQIDPELPAELSRICLTCLAKQATDRYQSTADLIDDLRHFLEQAPAQRTSAQEADPDPTRVAVVPQGLRSFQAEHADFYLDLLPGPHDREGLPKQVRFWKTQIESTAADDTFSVGMMYGPSGCGKSSLVKAGLLPRLAADVLPVVVEATATDTERRLENGLRELGLELPLEAGLPQWIAHLRSRAGSRPRKVLIVLDQFEQWLHAHPVHPDDQLVLALRQCDGAAVQCLVLVRDDFVSGLNRFFHQLEVPIVEGHNAALVDLFDVDHARRVLATFGRAYGRLPQLPAEPDPRQVRFLERAVDGLAVDGKVICVRLALFAEMMKGRPWTVDSLLDVGGTEGIGATFLEETFSAKTAPLSHRLHQKAARAVLSALLPEPGADIKGNRKSLGELLAVSEYRERDGDFEALLAILDTELRLITPAEPDPPAAQDAGRSAGNSKYYQLTHDYLVPSLRDWLTRKQKETRRGRAELRLAELASLWNAKRENRHLPSLEEFARIGLLTDTRKRSESEAAMMRRAGRFYALRLGAILASLLALLVAGLYLRAKSMERERQQRADNLAQLILTAEFGEVPGQIQKLDREGVRPLAGAILRSKLALPDTSPEKLRASLALIDADEAQWEYLIDRIPGLLPGETEMVRTVLASQPDAAESAARLWTSLEKMPADDRGILPTAATLASLAADDSRWQKYAGRVAQSLVQADVVQRNDWMVLLQTARRPLLSPLAEAYADRSEEVSDSQREWAAVILQRYAQDQPELLAELLISGTPEQFRIVYPRAARPENVDAVVEVAQQELATEPQHDWHDADPDPDWSQPHVAAVAEIEAGGGLLDEAHRFAFCQSMSRDRFTQIAEQLRPAGFRPTRVRPYRTAEGLRVAAVWRRDGRDWTLSWDSEKASLEDLSAPVVREGRVPIDLAGYSATENSGEIRYVVLWCAAGNADPRRRLRVDLDELSLVDAHQASREAGFPALESLQVTLDTARRRRYAAIWSSEEETSTLRAAYDGWPQVDQPHWDLALCGMDAPTRQALRQQMERQRELANQSLENRNDPSWPLLRRAVANYRLEEEGDAWTDLQTMVEAGLTSPLVQQYRALVAARLGNADAAREALREFLESADSDPARSRIRVAVTAWLEDKGQALRLLEEAAAMAVDDPRQLYEVACAAALAAHPAEEADPAETRPFLDFAMDLLNRAIDAGYQDGDSLRADADLAALYEDPGFARVLTRLPAYATTTRENTQFESRVVSNLSTAGQLNESEALRNEGFRPIAFAVASLDSHPKLTSASLWHRPWIPEETKERNAMRRANAAVVLASVGQADAIWPLLRHRPDPRLRSYLVDRLASEFVRPDAAWTQLRETEDRSVQIALLLVLGEFAKRKLLSAAQTEQLIAEFSSRYARHPDAGVHGACRWALEQAGAAAEVAKIDSAFAKGAVVGNRNWYVTRTGGHSLVVLDSQEPFLMGCEVRERKRSRGANRREESPRHRRLISRRFAIGAHEVTVAQFHAFKKDHQLPREKAREDDAPVINVLWYQAASYCNWLSQQEGLPRSQWCYDPEQAFASGMMLYPDYLQRTGYRLPSEAEWEYACRAGAITARHFGETDTLLPNYAWYTKNAQDRWLLPVGTLKPNDFGLFDTLGNTFEWCQERAFPFRTDRPMMSDLESVWEAERTINRAVDDKSTRPLKGGSFFSFTRFVRDGYRRFNSPAYPSEENGFRLARTMPATDQQE